MLQTIRYILAIKSLIQLFTILILIWPVRTANILLPDHHIIPAGGGHLYFRSKDSGNWTQDPPQDIWQCSADQVNWIDAPAYPHSGNSDAVEIRTGHQMVFNENTDLRVDLLVVSPGADLVISGHAKIIMQNGNAAGPDLQVFGKLKDAASNANGVSYDGGATWILGPSGIVEKSNGSSAGKYRDHFEGGIANMPDGSVGATWYYTYEGLGTVSVVANGMYYPNLVIRSAAGNHDWVGATEVFKGSTSEMIVQGDLTIEAGQTVYHNKSNTITLQGDLFNSGTLTNEKATTSVGAYIGGELDIRGSVVNSGLIDFSYGSSGSGQGILSMKGSSILSSADLLLCNDFQMNSPGGILLGAGNLLVSEVFSFDQNALFSTGGNAELILLSSDPSAIQNYSPGAYVDGRLRRATVTGSFIFPVGQSNACGYAPATILFSGTAPSSLLGYFDQDPAMPPPGILNCENDAFRYRYECNAGTWILQPVGGSQFEYQVIFVDACGCESAFYTIAKDQVPANTGCPTGLSYGFSGFSQFDLLGGGSILPVRFISFEAFVHSSHTILDWSVADKSNCAFFEIERSLSGRSFHSIGRMDCTEDDRYAGSYRFRDSLPPAGHCYYRIRQWDSNGEFLLSKVRVVYREPSGTTASVSISPNPCTHSVSLDIPDDRSSICGLAILASNGNTMYRKHLSGNVQKEFPLSIQTSTWPSGVYFCFVRFDSGNSSVCRIVKI